LALITVRAAQRYAALMRFRPLVRVLGVILAEEFAAPVRACVIRSSQLTVQVEFVRRSGSAV